GVLPGAGRGRRRRRRGCGRAVRPPSRRRGGAGGSYSFALTRRPARRPLSVCPETRSVPGTACVPLTLSVADEISTGVLGRDPTRRFTFPLSSRPGTSLNETSENDVRPGTSEPPARPGSASGRPPERSQGTSVSRSVAMAAATVRSTRIGPRPSGGVAFTDARKAPTTGTGSGTRGHVDGGTVPSSQPRTASCAHGDRVITKWPRPGTTRTCPCGNCEASAAAPEVGVRTSRSPESISTGTSGSGPGAGPELPDGAGQSVQANARLPLTSVAQGPKRPVEPAGRAASEDSSSVSRASFESSGAHGNGPSAQSVASSSAGFTDARFEPVAPAASTISRSSGP